MPLKSRLMNPKAPNALAVIAILRILFQQTMQESLEGEALLSVVDSLRPFPTFLFSRMLEADNNLPGSPTARPLLPLPTQYVKAQALGSNQMDY